jgi:hypothetical protein
MHQNYQLASSANTIVQHFDAYMQQKAYLADLDGAYMQRPAYLTKTNDAYMHFFISLSLESGAYI